jgi:hypothetical protein
MKQGGTAEAAIGGVIETIDSMINCDLFPVAKWSPQGEIVKEKLYIHNYFVDLL